MLRAQWPCGNAPVGEVLRSDQLEASGLAVLLLLDEVEKLRVDLAETAVVEGERGSGTVGRERCARKGGGAMSGGGREIVRGNWTRRGIGSRKGIISGKIQANTWRSGQSGGGGVCQKRAGGSAKGVPVHRPFHGASDRKSTIWE